jgi:hypothetical protein
MSAATVQHASHSKQSIQTWIDYAFWARQQQAWRFYAAPAREVQDSMQEVAERKLAEAHSRYQALQDTIAGVRFGFWIKPQHNRAEQLALAAATQRQQLLQPGRSRLVTCTAAMQRKE